MKQTDVELSSSSDYSPSCGKRRQSIPAAIKLEVLTEAGFMCGNPVCRRVLTLDIHHITPVSDNGGNESQNLLPLCPNCHALHTRRVIPQAVIRHWKGMLLALNHAFPREAVDMLLLLHKIQGQQFFISGDGLLKIACLIVAGLVTHNNLRCWMIGSQGSEAFGTYISLTEKGRTLVETWLSGDGPGYLTVSQTDASG